MSNKRLKNRENNIRGKAFFYIIVEPTAYYRQNGEYLTNFPFII
jgi:hypothetical protein